MKMYNCISNKTCFAVLFPVEIIKSHFYAWIWQNSRLYVSVQTVNIDFSGLQQNTLI